VKRVASKYGARGEEFEIGFKRLQKVFEEAKELFA